VGKVARILGIITSAIMIVLMAVQAYRGSPVEWYHCLWPAMVLIRYLRD